MKKNIKKVLIMLFVFSFSFALNVSAEVTNSNNAAISKPVKSNSGSQKSKPSASVADTDKGNFCYDFARDIGNNAQTDARDLVALKEAFVEEGLMTSKKEPYYPVVAVRQFQQKYASEVLTPFGFSEPTGFVGASTRDKLNELYGCGSGSGSGSGSSASDSNSAAIKNSNPSTSPDSSNSSRSNQQANAIAGVDDVKPGEQPKNPNKPGDANGDGMVNVNDLRAVINLWGPCPNSESSTLSKAIAHDCAADLNSNGQINREDAKIVIENWIR